MTQIMLFKQIWLYSNRRSFISGLHLRHLMNTPYFLNIFAHVLSKKQYPYFKYYAGNIVLLTPGEHGLFDQGTEEKRKKYAEDFRESTGGKQGVDWQRLYDLRERLKEEYKKHFPYSQGGIVAYKYSPEEVVHIVGKLNKKFWKKLKDGKANTIY